MTDHHPAQGAKTSLAGYAEGYCDALAEAMQAVSDLSIGWVSSGENDPHMLVTKADVLDVIYALFAAPVVGAHEPERGGE